MTNHDVTCVLDARAAVGEGAVWCPASQRLLWADVWSRVLHRFDPATGLDEHWTLPERVGCVAPAGPDAMVVGLESGIFSFVPSTQALMPYGLRLQHSTHNRCNDSVVDPTGRLFCGTMNLNGLKGPATGELYSTNGTGRPTLHQRDIYLANGLACSPDGKRLYLSDSHPDVNRIWSFELDVDAGTIANQQVFFDCRELSGRPDGATVDVDGCYWMCAVDGWEVLRITPAGKIDRRIPVPVAKPSKVAIGGARLDTLFITSIRANIEPDMLERQPQAGGLFAMHVGPIGIASPLMQIGF